MMSSGRVSMTSFGSGQTSGRALTGSGQNLGSCVDRVGSKSGSGVDRVGSKIRVRLRPVRDDVSMTSVSGNLNRFDRVENGSGQRLGRSCDWVTLTSANQFGFRSGACPSCVVVLNAREGASGLLR